MSIVGIDFGGLTSLVAQTAKGGIDCVLNDASNRQTAVCVSIQGKQRYLGDEGAALARSNFKNTFKMMKLLVGRKFDEPEVQEELSRSTFSASKLSDGGIGISVLYNDEDIIVPVEHILAMMLVKIKNIVTNANGNAGVGIADAVLAVPAWFTDAQRRGYIRACQIADLNCLKLVNEGTAIALSYGIYKSAKKLFSETEAQHVMFVDVGYSSIQITIADFIQEKLIIKASVCDRNCGGRNFDDIIVEYLAQTFQTKTGIDVRNNKKAMLKLFMAAEKGKKVLSPAGVKQTNINVECLAEDMDLNATLTRETLEEGASTVVSKFEPAMTRALTEANIEAKDLTDCEVVGGTIRIELVKRTLATILGMDTTQINCGLKTTMNADEAVCRGAALQCAMESSRVKVKPFNIIDRLQYGLIIDTQNANTNTSTGESKDDTGKDDGSPTNLGIIPIYTRGEEYPLGTRRITFTKMKADFSFDVSYSDDSKEFLPPGMDTRVGSYTVKIPEPYQSGDGYDVRVNFTIDKAMCFNITEVQLMELIEEPVPVSPPTPPTEAKESKDEAPTGDEKTDGSDTAETKTTEEGKEGTESKDTKPKRKFKKVPLACDITVFGMSEEQLKNACELEASMANEDRIIVETADRRNDLEGYIYSMRDRLDADLKPYATADEADTLKSEIMNSEEWLYGDGFEATKKEYVAKLAALKTISDKMEFRQNEHGNRDAMVSAMRRLCDSCKSFADSTDPAHDHITDEEKDTIRDLAKGAEEWLTTNSSAQNKLAINVDPVLTCKMIGEKQAKLMKDANPIMYKPKPVPKPEEKKESEVKEGESKSADADGTEEKASEGAADADADADTGTDKAEGDKTGDKMEIDNEEQSKPMDTNE